MHAEDHHRRKAELAGPAYEYDGIVAYGSRELGDADRNRVQVVAERGGFPRLRQTQTGAAVQWNHALVAVGCFAQIHAASWLVAVLSLSRPVRAAGVPAPLGTAEGVVI